MVTIKGYNELQEILVEDGVFKKIAPSIEVAADCEVEDLGGKLTLPPYVWSGRTGYHSERVCG